MKENTVLKENIPIRKNNFIEKIIMMEMETKKWENIVPQMYPNTLKENYPLVLILKL